MGQSSKELPEAVQQKISDVRQVLENLHRIAVEQETELDVLRAKNEELQRAIEEKKAAYDALSAQAAGEREKLRVSLDAMNEELKKNRENLEENRRNLEERKKALEKEKNKLDEDREQYERDYSKFLQTQNAFEEEKNKQGDLKEQCDAYLSQRNDLYRKYQDLQELYMAEKTRADELQTNLGEANEQIKILLDERNNARDEVAYWKQQAGQPQDQPQLEAPGASESSYEASPRDEQSLQKTEQNTEEQPSRSYEDAWKL